MSQTAPPQKAATIVLVDDALRVYLVKRHGRSGFMAGAHVFPGGRVDEADTALARALPDEAREAGRVLLSFGVRALDEALAFFVAGVRETVEESAILLARHGTALAADDVARRAHDMLESEKRAFEDVLAALDVVPAVDLLVPFSWWVTPEAEPRRYDTRFFLARVPKGQEATVDHREVTEGEWMTPEDALARYRRREIALAPPTLVTLEDLSGAASFDDMAARGAKFAGRMICPRLVTGETGLVLALPGDPLHDEREPAFAGVRSRIVMDDEGRFVSALEERR